MKTLGSGVMSAVQLAKWLAAGEAGLCIISAMGMSSL